MRLTPRLRDLSGLLCLSFVLSALVASPSLATIEAPKVVMRAHLPYRALADGESFQIPVDVCVKEGATLESIGLRSDLRQAAISLDSDVRARPVPTPGYQHQVYLLTGSLEPGLDRVRVQATVDGEVWEESLSLRSLGDPVASDAETGMAKVVLENELDPNQFSRPEPVPSGFPTNDGSLAKTARTVRVHGQVVMRVSDTGPDRGVDGATVYFMQVRDILDDIELATTTTDINGTFDFNASVDGTHDVYVKIRAINSVANIGTDFGFQTYGRNLSTTRGFSGTDYNTGMVRFSDSMNHALWLLTTFTREHRWYAYQGFDLPSVNCRWWDDVLGSSCYLPVVGMEGIHLRSSAEWDGSTAVHEYSHHFVNSTDVQEVWPPFYLTGYCDPGHCGNCPENEAVAWSEGLPYFLEQVINTAHTSTYGWVQPGITTYETVGNCPQDGLFGVNPQSTENFLAAFLNDLIDTNADTSPLAVGVTETCELQLSDIFHVATTGRASNSVDFVDDFRNYVATSGLFTPADQSAVWAAAAINGFATDTVAPTPPTSVLTPTHTIGVPSPSNRPQITIIGATDDDSGVTSYHVDIAASAGAPGPGAVTSDSATLLWPTILEPGTYWVNVTALDQAGNESAPYSHGPIVVDTPTPLDFTFALPGFWEDEVLVRQDQTVTSETGAIETQPIGGLPTYLSMTFQNASVSSGTPGTFYNRIRIDGSIAANGMTNDPLVGAGEQYQLLNVGPVSVAGGRHHVSASLDDVGDVAEDDETNNRIDRYVVFRPSPIVAGTWNTFGSPPIPYTTEPPGTQAYPNVAGHRIVPTNDFAGVIVTTPNSWTDVGVRLHDASTGWDNGFETPLAYAHSTVTQEDVVLMNKAALGGSSFDVGVERMSRTSTWGYSIREFNSQVMAPGDDTTLNWTNDENLGMLEFFFDALSTGILTVSVDADFADDEEYPELEFYWMTPSTGTLIPADTTAEATTDADGHATLHLSAPSTGTYCLVVYRDTTHAPAAKVASGEEALNASQPATIQVTTQGGPAVDLSFLRDAPYWDLPFMATPYPVSGPKLSIPSDLIGGDYDTYLNYGLRNLGDLGASNITVRADLDGDTNAQFYFDFFSSVGAGAAATSYGTNAVLVSGGRHTMTLNIDPYGEIAESNESNNTMSMQFGWSGPDLVNGVNMTSSAPPAPEAGRESLEMVTNPTGMNGEDPVDTPVNFWHVNCDGFRMPAFAPKAAGGTWAGVATMPGAASNVDVELNEVLPPIEAFARPVASSTWGTGESDFVVVDRGSTTPRPFDVGVINAGGNENYDIVSLTSVDLGQPSGGVYGPFGMDAGGFLQLKETYLGPGSYTVKLIPQTADADLGLSVFFPTSPLEQPFFSKDAGRDRLPMSYSAPKGATETVQFDVPYGREGTFCLAVWKVAAADMPQNQDYSIQITGTAAPQPCIWLDGNGAQEYGSPASVQTVQTAFGDASLGQVDLADGSELDQVFAKICDTTLYLTFSGNLESNYNDLEIFIDSRPGGQNRLRGDNYDFGGAAALNRMGDDGNGNGFTFDAAMAPDWWFSVQGGTGEAYSGIPYRLFAYQAELLDAGGGEGHFLGATVAGSNAPLGGAGADNPHGVRVAIDNSNTAGVGPGTGAASGAGVTTGVELAIPLEAIGNPTGCLRVMAFVNGTDHDFVSNQMLPPLPVGTANLGEPRSVDLDAIAGTQYFDVCLGGITAAGDTPPTTPDVALEPPAPNPFNPQTTLAFRLPRAATVELVIYDIAGRRVRTLVGGQRMNPGRHEFVWTGTDDQGSRVASGSYVVRMLADGVQQVRRLALLK